MKPDVIPDYWSEEMVDHHFFANADEALKEMRKCILELNNKADGRARCWANIEGKEPCSPELHAGARLLGEEQGVGTTYHNASTIEEARCTSVAVRFRTLATGMTTCSRPSRHTFVNTWGFTPIGASFCCGLPKCRRHH